MRLQIGSNIDNDRVRLDFRKSPTKPDNIPSYSIEKKKADEFVKKYNKQEKDLLKLTSILTVIFGLLAGLLALYKNSKKLTLLGIPTGLLLGFGTGTLISSHQKNKLMDTYNVKEFSRKN